MLNKMRNRQGFTLIELLIVVAIIGILAAIAIPQFSAYQKRGYASAVRSDVKNVNTALKAAFADNLSVADVTGLATPIPTIVAGSNVNGPAVYGSANISTGVTINVTNGYEATQTGHPAYIITGTHAKLPGGSASYILTGDGFVTDTLSAAL